MTTEKEYLRSYDKNEFDRPSVAVDLLVFTVHEDRLKVVLIERSEHPYKDMLSLPGVFVGIDGHLSRAAGHDLDHVFLQLHGPRRRTCFPDLYPG